LLEAGYPVTSGDEVVMHHDGERLADLDELAGLLDIGEGGCRIPAGMVVQQTSSAI
jgi:hypothetical protein